MKCVVCKDGDVKLFKKITKDNTSYDYYIYSDCSSIFLDPELLNKIDKGERITSYSNEYWDKEISSAKQRAFGVGMSRMSEVFYYSRIPIKKFLDIGTGPGYFLDAIEKYLPSRKEMYYGSEKYPPIEKYCTNSCNYIIGELRDIKLKFDAGM